MPGGSVHTVSGTGDVTGGLALAVQHTVPLDPYRSISIVTTPLPSRPTGKQHFLWSPCSCIPLFPDTYELHYIY